MVINEKALVTRMKEAYKSYGYRLQQSESGNRLYRPFAPSCFSMVHHYGAGQYFGECGEAGRQGPGLADQDAEDQPEGRGQGWRSACDGK